MEIPEETKKRLDEWNAKIDEAATNICQCLDGCTISESKYILERVNYLLHETVIHVSNIRGIDGKR